MKPAANAQQKPLKTAKPHNTHTSMKFVIVLANCFALLPVEKAISNHVEHLCFRWRSLKILYAVITLMAAGFTLITGIIYLFEMSTFEMIGKSFYRKLDLKYPHQFFCSWICVLYQLDHFGDCVFAFGAEMA